MNGCLTGMAATPAFDLRVNLDGLLDCQAWLVEDEILIEKNDLKLHQRGVDAVCCRPAVLAGCAIP